MSETAPVSRFMTRLWLAVFVLALALFLWVVRDAVLLGFAAVLLAVAVHGVADGLGSIVKAPRWAELAAAAMLLIGIIVGVLWLFGAQLASELSGVFERLPGAWERAKETVGSSPFGAALVSEVERLTSDESEGSMTNLLARAGSYALPFASGVTTALLVLFAAAFLTTSAGSYRAGVLLLFPKGMDETIGQALSDSARALRKWLFGITIDMAIIAASLAIVLWALGVPAFIGLALIAGFAQFVPTVGPLIASVPAILLAFTVSPMTALWTTIAYFVISQLEANVIYPIIQKKAASIAPALNLMAVLAFGILFGPLGVLLATPILIVLTVFTVRLYVQRSLGKEAEAPGD